MPTKTVQPLAVAQIPDAHLTLPTVIAVTGLSESSVRRLVDAGKFPRPIKAEMRGFRWRAAAVTAWLQAHGG